MEAAAEAASFSPPGSGLELQEVNPAGSSVTSGQTPVSREKWAHSPPGDTEDLGGSVSLRSTLTFPQESSPVSGF